MRTLRASSSTAIHILDRERDSSSDILDVPQGNIKTGEKLDKKTKQAYLVLDGEDDQIGEAPDG